MPRVFLSHATPDRKFVESEIVPLLSEHGIDTWFSQTDIKAASDWEKMIRSALAECDWFLVVMSEESLKSPWVLAEVRWAMEERRDQFVPVLFQPCKQSDFHLMMPTIQFVDFTGDLAHARKLLLEVWNIQSGEEFSARFEDKELIGRGGMGEVWLARDRSLERLVAIKRVRPDLLGSNLEKRIIQESRDVARLNHPNVVAILNTDRDERGAFLVLEYMEGGSLRERLDQAKLDPVEALACLRQLLEALEHAHKKGILHRDIKPENILFSRSGIPKLADFGLAWLLDSEEEEGRPAPRTPEGTRHYLAPELLEGEQPDLRSDLYSLGITFYEMLTGRDAHPIREREIPSTFLPFFRKLTSAQPAMRYTSAESALEACKELERALELAGRSDEEAAARLARTVTLGHAHASSGNLVDAQSCFERVIVEDPDSAAGTAGLLLVQLIRGDMAASAPLFVRLRERAVSDPVFDCIHAFFDGFDSPLQLEDSPQILPFSYELAALGKGRRTKDLVEWGPGTINLGDLGELLVDLMERQEGLLELTQSDPKQGRHTVAFDLGDLKVNATYELRMSKGGLFRSAKLESIQLFLEIRATPFEIYRLVRYLTQNLEKRYKRRPGGTTGDWQHLECDFTAIAADAARPGAAGE